MATSRGPAEPSGCRCRRSGDAPCRGDQTNLSDGIGGSPWPRPGRRLPRSGRPRGSVGAGPGRPRAHSRPDRGRDAIDPGVDEGGPHEAGAGADLDDGRLLVRRQGVEEQGSARPWAGTVTTLPPAVSTVRPEPCNTTSAVAGLAPALTNSNRSCRPAPLPPPASHASAVGSMRSSRPVRVCRVPPPSSPSPGSPAPRRRRPAVSLADHRKWSGHRCPPGDLASFGGADPAVGGLACPVDERHDAQTSGAAGSPGSRDDRGGRGVRGDER